MAAEEDNLLCNSSTNCIFTLFRSRDDFCVVSLLDPREDSRVVITQVVSLLLDSSTCLLLCLCRESIAIFLLLHDIFAHQRCAGGMPTGALRAGDLHNQVKVALTSTSTAGDGLKGKTSRSARARLGGRLIRQLSCTQAVHYCRSRGASRARVR